MSIWNDDLDEMLNWDFVIFDFGDHSYACGVPLKKDKKIVKRWAKLDDFMNLVQQQQSEINRLRRVLKNIIECAPACYNTDECPLKNGDGFDNGCGYNCAYFLAHEALDAEKETKKALQPSEAEQC